MWCAVRPLKLVIAEPGTAADGRCFLGFWDVKLTRPPPLLNWVYYEAVGESSLIFYIFNLSFGNREDG